VEPRALQKSPVADEAHRDQGRPHSWPGSVDVAASPAVPHAAVPAQTPADDSDPARAVWELLAVARRHNWKRALVAAVRSGKADAVLRLPAAASMLTSECWAARRQADELLSVTVVPNNLWDMGSQVANRLAANVAAATIRPAVDYSGMPDTPAEAEKAPPDGGRIASEVQSGPAWDVAIEQTKMRAKTTGSPASNRPPPPSRI
jgi:hypothetical protein